MADCFSNITDPPIAFVRGVFVRRQGGSKPVADEAFVPEVLYGGKYYPICGHYFWDNDNGATTVCKALGFISGARIRTDTVYEADAMPVGECKSGEALNRCTGGGNAWGDFGFEGGKCKKYNKGSPVGVQVICKGK